MENSSVTAEKVHANGKYHVGVPNDIILVSVISSLGFYL